MSFIEIVRGLFSRRTGPIGFEIIIPFSFPTEQAKKKFLDNTNEFLNNKITIL